MSEIINAIMQQARQAFDASVKITAENRAALLEEIALGLEAAGEPLLELAASETNLTPERLRGERGRTCFQLRMFASLIRQGDCVEAIIDHSKPDKTPPAPDLRRMRIPMGPVVVFGASNFPFAYSTAGGDTASALAAGCPVVVKQHPAHAQTSNRVYEIIREAIKVTGLPEFLVQHVSDEGFATGKALVQHPETAAVGFTGSYAGGMALEGYARERKHPIPVFAEMGSTNPVMILPGALAEKGEQIGKQMAASITLGMGQFCTNPGLMFCIKGEGFESMVEAMQSGTSQFVSFPMLHGGIEKAFLEKTKEALSKKGINLLVQGNQQGFERFPQPVLATISAQDFLASPGLHEEIFGPWSLLVVCDDTDQMEACRETVGGQLTSTLMATEDDLVKYSSLVDVAIRHAGRVVFNAVPTGVEVSAAMVHGGPHPASTDGRFSAVGPTAIQRWTRPVCWQNAPDFVLPPELKEINPLGIIRLTDGAWKR